MALGCTQRPCFAIWHFLSRLWFFFQTDISHWCKPLFDRLQTRFPTRHLWSCQIEEKRAKHDAQVTALIEPETLQRVNDVKRLFKSSLQNLCYFRGYFKCKSPVRKKISYSRASLISLWKIMILIHGGEVRFWLLAWIWFTLLHVKVNRFKSEDEWAPLTFLWALSWAQGFF